MNLTLNIKNLIFLTSFSSIFSKLDEITLFKALVCVNIITTRHQKENLDPNTLSPLILSCYIKISDEQVHRLTEGIEKGLDIPLSDEEIDNLMDVDSLKDLSESEVKRKGDELENAIKQFQKMQEGYGETGDEDDGYDDGDDDYDYEDYGEGPRNNISSIGIFRLIKKGLINLSEIFFGSWYIIGILVLFYVLLLEIRRNNNPNNNEDEAEEEKEENQEEEKKEDNINNENKNKDEKIKEEEEKEKRIKEEKKIEEEKLVKEENVESSHRKSRKREKSQRRSREKG